MWLFACVRVLRDKVDQLEKELALLQSSSRSSLPASCSPVKLDLCDLISGLPSSPALGAEYAGGLWDTPCGFRDTAHLVDRTPALDEERDEFPWNVEAAPFIPLHSAAAVGVSCTNLVDCVSGVPPAPPERCQKFEAAKVAVAVAAPDTFGASSADCPSGVPPAPPEGCEVFGALAGSPTEAGVCLDLDDDVAVVTPYSGDAGLGVVPAAIEVGQVESLSSGGTQGLSSLTNKVVKVQEMACVTIDNVDRYSPGDAVAGTAAAQAEQSLADRFGDATAAPSAPPEVLEVETAGSEIDLTVDQALERYWVHLTPKMKDKFESLENIGDLGCILLHGHTVQVAEQLLHRRSFSSACTTRPALASLVARGLVKTWKAQKTIHRLLADDYNGLVAMLAESVVEAVTT